MYIVKLFKTQKAYFSIAFFLNKTAEKLLEWFKYFIPRFWTQKTTEARRIQILNMKLACN